MFVAHERSSTADAGRVHKLTRHERRSYTPHDFWRDFVPLLVIGLGAWVLLVGTPSEKDLRAVEKRDRDTQRATAYRLCTRNKVDRAFAHGRIRGISVRGEPSQVPGIPTLERRARIQLSRLLMRPGFLPILNCAPNLEGLGAAPMSIAEQERFLRAWSRRYLPPAEIGVCPHSAIGGAVQRDRC
jgi:hypothetical protein